MKIELDLTKAEEQFIKDTIEQMGVDINDYVKDLLLDDLEMMHEFNMDLSEALLNAENEEEIRAAMIEQMRKMNPEISEEEATELLNSMAAEEDILGGIFHETDDENSDDTGGPSNIIPFNKK